MLGVVVGAGLDAAAHPAVQTLVLVTVPRNKVAFLSNPSILLLELQPPELGQDKTDSSSLHKGARRKFLHS